MRQTVGFAVLGALVALLVSTLGGAYGPGVTFEASYVSGSSLGYAGVDPLWATTLLGTVVGGVVGASLRLLGFTMSGPPGNRLVRVVVAGIAGAAVGLAIAVGVAFGGVFDSAPAPAVILGVYAACAVVAYVLALAAVALVLRLSQDVTARATVRTTAIALIPGGALATAAGVGVAWLLDFTTSESTWIAVVVAVGLVLAATFAAARVVALARPAEYWRRHTR
ncbi:hypothetical protein [Gordonia neofelifaecis]|uniref:Uncharacterized protein n=1 Tax=Gordonia neofelifaecis NRRL B-59395 TaxID=644548 RepID=F1YHV6_9ACTN|nr:hypothetical protein [Gordonia neofelifaecis]EGD55510.1 hypothetical protein SCNU_07353 [Gordonia neofelifaecis NRRL B-59395]